MHCEFLFVTNFPVQLSFWVGKIFWCGRRASESGTRITCAHVVVSRSVVVSLGPRASALRSVWTLESGLSPRGVQSTHMGVQL